MSIPVLSLCIFIPLTAALLLAIRGPAADGVARPVALLATAVSFGISLGVTFSYASTGETFTEQAPWFPQAGINYVLGIDGLSVYMLLLATWITLVAVWLTPAHTERPRLYYGLMLVLATGMYGVFCAIDLVLFYIFWETVFIPIYFLMAIWGAEGAQKAALKFLIFMIVGSLVMLLGIVGVYFESTPHTFDLRVLSTESFGLGFQRLAFAAFFIGFAVKVPVFPFHVWLPDAYTLSPTPLTALMSAALAAMGAYGFWRIPVSVLPDGFNTFSWLIAVLAVISIVYGDLCATAQKDLKRMTAYASVAHMGFVMLGIAAANTLGLTGSVLQTFAHGIAMASLFFVVEYLVLIAGSRDTRQLRLLWAKTPLLASAFWLVMLGSFAMPGLATFPGELTIVLGTFQRYPIAALIALAGAIITAGYIFWVLSRVTLGNTGNVTPAPKDLAGKRLVSVVIFAVLLIAIGIFPVLVTGPIQSSVEALVTRIGG
jgi:NADH-quinone oxidoreductase subunit M